MYRQWSSSSSSSSSSQSMDSDCDETYLRTEFFPSSKAFTICFVDFENIFFSISSHKMIVANYLLIFKLYSRLDFIHYHYSNWLSHSVCMSVCWNSNSVSDPNSVWLHRIIIVIIRYRSLPTAHSTKQWQSFSKQNGQLNQFEFIDRIRMLKKKSRKRIFLDID